MISDIGRRHTPLSGAALRPGRPASDRPDPATGQIPPASGATANAGDVTENAFTMTWRCGTAEVAGPVPMNAVSLLNQNPSPTPDRYITNVLFELASL